MEHNLNSECIDTGDCTEVSIEDETAICYSKNCHHLPGYDSWLQKGSHEANLCYTDDLYSCIKRQGCAYYKRDDDSYGCEFWHIAQFVAKSLVCKRGDSPGGAIDAVRPLENAEDQQMQQGAFEEGRKDFEAIDDDDAVEERLEAMRAADAPTTCEDCVAAGGYAWSVNLLQTGKGLPKMKAFCAKNSECMETSGLKLSTFCFYKHCEKMYKVDNIDWWKDHTQEYKRCRPDAYHEDCTSDPLCALYRDHETKKYVCSFIMFNPWINNELICHNQYTW